MAREVAAVREPEMAVELLRVAREAQPCAQGRAEAFIRFERGELCSGRFKRYVNVGGCVGWGSGGGERVGEVRDARGGGEVVAAEAVHPSHVGGNEDLRIWCEKKEILLK